MNNRNTKETSAPVVKGSWEDILNQAHRAAGNQNDEAISLYEKVVNGLLRLPVAQREAQKGRLQELLKTAAVNLHVYQTQRDQYDAALATLDQIQNVIAPDEKNSWQQRRAMVLTQAERGNEALAQLRALATGENATLTDWGNLVTQLIKLKHFDEASAAIDETAAWHQQQAKPEAQTNPNLTAAYLENLRCIVALASGQYQEGIAHYERASELDQDYRNRPYLLYARLIFYEQPALALPYLQRDTQHSIRAGFWHGVALKRLGKPDEARRQWEKVIKQISPKMDNEQFVELVLSFYYLGDKEGVGLNGVLRALQSGGAQSWVLLFLAGLGWMLRDNLTSARSNFALAVGRRKASAEGTKLSPEVWQHCVDLLTPEQQQQIAEYFQAEK